MKILYGTSNPAKLQHMRENLRGLDIEIIGLDDIDISVDKIDESGNNPLENARIKALEYYKAADMPVFSCDSGLYIEGLESSRQPGVHVRRVKGQELSDDEMIEYYGSIASELGGSAIASYKNAICLVLDDDNIFEYDGDQIAYGPFLMVSEPHEARTPGFPLDSISREIPSGKYFMDMDFRESSASEYKIAQGFKEFFIRASKKIK